MESWPRWRLPAAVVLMIALVVQVAAYLITASPSVLAPNLTIVVLAVCVWVCVRPPRTAGSADLGGAPPAPGALGLSVVALVTSVAAVALVLVALAREVPEAPDTWIAVVAEIAAVVPALVAIGALIGLVGAAARARGDRRRQLALPAEPAAPALDPADMDPPEMSPDRQPTWKPDQASGVVWQTAGAAAAGAAATQWGRPGQSGTWDPSPESPALTGSAWDSEPVVDRGDDRGDDGGNERASAPAVAHPPVGPTTEPAAEPTTEPAARPDTADDDLRPDNWWGGPVRGGTR